MNISMVIKRRDKEKMINKTKKNLINYKNFKRAFFLILGLFLALLHTILSGIIFYVTYFNNNITLLLPITILTLYILIQWIFIGFCIISPLENYLLKDFIKFKNRKNSLLLNYVNCICKKYLRLGLESTTIIAYIILIVILISQIIKLYLLRTDLNRFITSSVQAVRHHYLSAS